jgi:hypothetical protein
VDVWPSGRLSLSLGRSSFRCRCVAGLAAAIGLGRFAFTTVLPMMQDSEGVSAGTGSLLAGATTRATSSALSWQWCWSGAPWDSSPARRVALHGGQRPGVAVARGRVITGAASALLFIAVVRMIVKATWSHHNTAWAYDGVGAEIALSSIMAAVCDLFGAGLPRGC